MARFRILLVAACLLEGGGSGPTKGK